MDDDFAFPETAKAGRLTAGPTTRSECRGAGRGLRAAFRRGRIQLDRLLEACENPRRERERQRQSIGLNIQGGCIAVKLAAPRSPRDVLSLFQEYRESEGIEALFERVDWSTSTPDQIRSAFRVTPASAAESIAAKSAEGSSADFGDEGKRIALSIIRSHNFQENLIAFVLQALPEKRRLSFVHIPKCGGTTVNALLGRKFPWLNDHLSKPAWTDEKGLYRALWTIAHRAPKSEFVFISCHRNIRWFVDQGIHRAGDRMFTVIRHPYEMVFSQVNYMVKRFRQDPDLTVPDTRDWAKQIGMARFEGALDSARAKSIAIELFDNARLTRPDLLRSYLGGGHIQSALENIQRSGIEIVSLNSLDRWLEVEWGIKTPIKENQSEPVLSIGDLDITRTAKLIGDCAEEISFHDYLLKVHALPGSSAAVGRNSLSAGFSSDAFARAEEMVSIFYRALLNREPDPQGLRNHVDSIARGETLQRVLTRFLRSAEFVNRVARDPSVVHLLSGSGSSVKGLENGMRTSPPVAASAATGPNLSS